MLDSTYREMFDDVMLEAEAIAASILSSHTGDKCLLSIACAKVVAECLKNSSELTISHWFLYLLSEIKSAKSKT